MAGLSQDSLSQGSLASLAFWAKNMSVLRESGYSWWPGFSYTPAEWDEIERLAKPIDGGAYLKFIGLNALLFIVFTGIAVVGFMLPVLLLLYPDPSKLQPLPFVLLLASVAAITIGVGLPLSMKISAWLCASEEVKTQLVASSETEKLGKRVSWQLLRMTLIMCGLLIPGVLLWIALDIQGGPLLTAIKAILALIFIGSTALVALRR